jgi:Sap, sulfolipid-1-addressing protein
MVVEAAGFAVLAAISPTALLMAAVFLGGASPRRSLLYYLTGAFLVTVIMGVAVLLILHAGGFDRPRYHDSRYELRAGLGVLALAAAVFVARRRRRRPPGPVRKSGLLWRMATHPSPLTALAVGVILFMPSVTFIAAVQVIATSQAGAASQALAFVLVVVISVSFVWLPLLLYLVSPDATVRGITACNEWLRTHGHLVVVAVLVVAGLALVVDGAVGLAS